MLKYPRGLVDHFMKRLRACQEPQEVINLMKQTDWLLYGHQIIIGIYAAKFWVLTKREHEQMLKDIEDSFTTK